MPYPDFLVGEPLHKGSELVILDARNPTQTSEQPADPIKRGATGAVWLARQENVIERAVKILSPEQELFKQGDWKYFADVFDREMRKLARLTHSHLAKLISFGRIPPDEVPMVDTKGVGIPYIVMEYVEGQPLHEFIISPALLDNCANPVEVVLDLFDDVLSALQYMHQQDGMHSDVKEMNILVRQSHRPEAVLVDLGAAHIFKDDHPEYTTYVATHGRVSKEWQQRIATKVLSSSLKKNRVLLDLYMFGAMLRLFLNERLSDSPATTLEEQPKVLVSLKRILQYGIVVLDRVADKCLKGVYSSAEEIRQDLAAIRPRLISPFGIAELSLRTDTKTSLALPEDSVPFTKRMIGILNHPTVQRLRNISQLDFISMIYIGAIHTRLLHSVETYQLARLYLSTLLVNPVFSAYCDEPSKLEATLLAGFLHDIGHYPLGHVFEDFAFRGEATGPFANILRDERVTSALLDEPADEDTWVRDAANQHIAECRRIFRTKNILTLPNLIRQLFGEQVLFCLRRILADKEDEDEGILILRSIVNGPLDVDKVCYLRTDSRYSGAAYGNAVDVDGILASLVCTVDDKPGIAIIEKGICAAESVATGRRWMYQRVYWHRTNRAIMAMIRFAPQYLLQKGILTFAEYFEATYSISDIEAVKWLNKKFQDACKDNDFENPAKMIIDGRRGIYKTLLEFGSTNTDEADERIRLYLMGRSCAEWSEIAFSIATLAKEYVPDTKMTDVLIDIPSKQRHEIGDPMVFRTGKNPRKLSELSAEFKGTKKFFEEGALSCRIFIHPFLRKSLVAAKKLGDFQKKTYALLKESTPR